MQNTGIIQDEETAEYCTMSVNEDEEKDFSEENDRQHQESCPVKTLATVSLSVSLTALVISCVFGTLVMIRYFSPETNVDKIPELCRLPPDPGPCSSSVNRQVIISHGHVMRSSFILNVWCQTQSPECHPNLSYICWEQTYPSLTKQTFTFSQP